jgi:hypothetical protein
MIKTIIKLVNKIKSKTINIKMKMKIKMINNNILFLLQQSQHLNKIYHHQNKIII